MNEATLAARFRERLRKRGSFVLRHADQFRRGVPDTSYSEGHATTWIEFKAAWVADWQALFSWASVIRPKDYVQLATMLMLANHARAKYILFQMKRGTTQARTYWASPGAVATSMRLRQKLPLKLWRW